MFLIHFYNCYFFVLKYVLWFILLYRRFRKEVFFWIDVEEAFFRIFYVYLMHRGLVFFTEECSFEYFVCRFTNVLYLEPFVLDFYKLFLNLNICILFFLIQLRFFLIGQMGFLTYIESITFDFFLFFFIPLHLLYNIFFVYPLFTTILMLKYDYDSFYIKNFFFFDKNFDFFSTFKYSFTKYYLYLNVLFQLLSLCLTFLFWRQDEWWKMELYIVIIRPFLYFGCIFHILIYCLIYNWVFTLFWIFFFFILMEFYLWVSYTIYIFKKKYENVF